MQPRASLVALAALALAVSGCVGQQPPPAEQPGPGGDAGGADAAVYPEPISVTQDVTLTADPTGILNPITGGSGPCPGNPSACYRYPFTLENNATVDATLSWTVDANDFDLFVYEGDEQVAASADAPPENTETVRAQLPAGEYELLVLAYLVAQDTFTLEATFGPSAGGNGTA